MVKKRAWERSDKIYLNASLIPYFGEYELSEITTFDIEQFIAKRIKDGVRKSTVNRDLSCLRKMFNKAFDWNYLAASPFKGIRLFSEAEYKRERVLSHREQAKLYKEAAPHLKPIIICALMTAMRKSEILGLQWKSVNLVKREIIVQATSAKSGKSRTIPINDTLFKELVKLKRMNGKSNGYVFLYKDPGTGKMRPVKSVKRAFMSACKRANIKNLTFHDLRHVASSLMIERGASLVTVQALLGHSHLQTTEIYLHSDMKQLRKAVELLEKVH